MAEGIKVKELFTLWGFEIDDGPIKEVHEKLEKVKSAVAGIALSMGAAAGTIFGFAKLTADAGDQALKQSQKLGINIEKLQELQFAAKQSGISHEELGVSLGFLSRNLFEAAKGSKEAQQSLSKAGIDLKAFGGKLPTTDQALEQIANRFKSLPDGPLKTALAMDVFGRSGKNLLPLFKDGAKGMAELGVRARQLGIVFDKETAEKAEKFNDTLEEMHESFNGVRNLVGNALIPILTKLAHNVTEFVIANRKLIASKVQVFIQFLSKYLEISWRFLNKLWESATGAWQVMNKLGITAERVGFALALLAGANFLFAIGNAVTAVYGLITAFAAADVAALALPVAIGAAFVALGLIIEDVFRYFNGDQSITGKLVDKVQKDFPTVANVIVTSFNFVKDVITDTITAVTTLWGWFTKIGSWVIGTGGSFLKGLSDVFGSDSKSNTALSDITPTAAPALGGANSSQNNDFNIINQFTVPDGTSPAMVGQKVKEGVEASVLDPHLRAAQRNFVKGVAY